MDGHQRRTACGVDRDCGSLESQREGNPAGDGIERIAVTKWGSILSIDSADSRCAYSLAATPVKTPVRLPRNVDGAYPALSRPSHAISSISRCWGSIQTASRGEMPKNSGTTSRSRVVAWALWDCGATGVNAVVITFVFSVYLTEQVGSGLPGPTTPASGLGRVLTIAGLCVALLAPATGIWVDAAHRRRTALAVLTGGVVAMTSAMSLIRDDYHYLWPGLILLACTAACSDLATVPTTRC
jgi:hypothetical protein